MVFVDFRDDGTVVLLGGMNDDGVRSTVKKRHLSILKKGIICDIITDQVIYGKWWVVVGVLLDGVKFAP